jgi:hypothetical protein
MVRIRKDHRKLASDTSFDPARRWVVAVLVAGFALAVAVISLPRAASAGSALRLDGNGVATFGQDVNGDDVEDGALYVIQVAVDADVAEGTVQLDLPRDPSDPEGPGGGPAPQPAPSAGATPEPPWTCPEDPGLVDRGEVCVTGSVSEATTDPNGVHISGSATVVFGQVRVDTGVPIALDVAPGGAGEGWVAVQLTGVLDGKLGDQERGDGDYHPPTLDVVTGELVLNARAPEPSPTETSPSPSPTTPSPTPTTPSPTATTPSPTQTHTPTPTPTSTSTFSYPPYTPPPYTPPSYVPPTYGATQAPVPGWFSTARLVAILNDLGPTGVSLQDAFLQVVGPFPVAGLATWHDDWHAYRCCPVPHDHQGIDIFAARGTPVVATFDGTVTQKVVDPDWGGLGLEITDGGGTQYYYAHFDRFATGVDLGDRVTQGQVVGYVGTSGNAPENAPHLHFEVQPDGIAVPPLPYVNQWLDQAEAEATLLVIERTGHAPFITAGELDLGEGLAGDATGELVAYPDDNLGAPVGPTVTSAAGPSSVPVGGAALPASSSAGAAGDRASDTGLVFAVAGLAFMFLLLVSLRQGAVARRAARVERHRMLRATAGNEEVEPVRIVTLPETEVIAATADQPEPATEPTTEPAAVPEAAPVPAASEAAIPAEAEEVDEGATPDEPVVIVVLPEVVGPRAAAVSVAVGEGHATASSDALETVGANGESPSPAPAGAVGDASVDKPGRSNGRTGARSNGKSNGRSNGHRNGRPNGAGAEAGNGRSKATAARRSRDGAGGQANGPAKRGTTGAPEQPTDDPATNGDQPSSARPISAPRRD